MGKCRKILRRFIMFANDSTVTDGKLFFRYVIPSMISMLTVCATASICSFWAI